MNKWIYWMRRALQLAALADGFTSPNPLVGALVLDKEGNLIGEGFHPFAGESHAEVFALKQAGKKAKGGTLIVTLEPCCHFGKTPPCTELILMSGIKRVVIALEDPDLRVSGKGISYLRKNNIDVITGVLEKEALKQNRAFVFRVKYGRPWGILKWAMSLDGRIGLKNGLSKWISGEESRSSVHKIRSKVDAVIIGGSTLRRDNPLLTSRGLRNPEPLRVVFSKSLDFPAKAQLWETNLAKTVIAFGPSPNKHFDELPNKPEKLEIRASSPKVLLEALAKKDCNKILWECGPNLATQAISEGCVQELIVFISPKLIGGDAASTPLSDFGYQSMDEVLLINDFATSKKGKDIVIRSIFDDFDN